MMANNWQRLSIWLNLVNRFDYAEFCDTCANQSVQPLQALEFAQKAGMISVGITMFPDLPESEAYLKFIQANQIAANDPTSVYQKATTVATKQGCCGGGEIK